MAVRLSAHTVDINAGTLDGVTIGGSVKGAVSTSALIADTADINGGTIDNVVIGGSTPLAGSFTTLSASSGLDSTIIGANTAAAGSFTTGNFSGLVSLTTATGSASPTPTELRIGTSSSASDWSVVNPWGRLAFYSQDTSGSGPKPHVVLDAVASNAIGASASLSIKVTSESTNTLTEAMNIAQNGNATFSGNVGIGAAPSFKLDVSDATSECYIRVGGGVADDAGFRIAEAGVNKWLMYNEAATDDLVFYSNSGVLEAARIDASGNLLVGTTSTTLNTTNFGTALRSLSILGHSRDVNGTLSVAYIGGNAGYAQILGDGDLENTNNSYGALSDIKLKENIEDATPKLEQLNQVRVVNYNLIARPEVKQIGVIAQELEQIFPGMIKETSDVDEDGNPTGTVTKSVKYSVFVPMLIKAMQEQQAIIDALTARIEALEA